MSREKTLEYRNWPSFQSGWASTNTRRITPSLRRRGIRRLRTVSLAASRSNNCARVSRVSAELAEEVTQILLGGAAQQVQLRLVRAQDAAAGRQPFQADGRMVEEVRQVLLAAAQRFFRLLALGDIADDADDANDFAFGVAEGLALRAALRGYAHAAMDLSDGLAGDLAKMLAASGLTAEIRRGSVFIGGAGSARDRGWLIGALLTGGDDYEILAAVA